VGAASLWAWYAHAHAAHALLPPGAGALGWVYVGDLADAATVALGVRVAKWQMGRFLRDALPGVRRKQAVVKLPVGRFGASIVSRTMYHLGDFQDRPLTRRPLKW
jgi:hypothetical protein